MVLECCLSNQADSVDYKPETNNEILVGREYEFSTKTNAKSGAS